MYIGRAMSQKSPVAHPLTSTVAESVTIQSFDFILDIPRSFQTFKALRFHLGPQLRLAVRHPLGTDAQNAENKGQRNDAPELPARPHQRTPLAHSLIRSRITHAAAATTSAQMMRATI